jgi:pimeloyl-ACP methyl ester carboxylesterase
LKNGYCPIILEQRYMGECGGDNYGPGCSPNGQRKDFISVYPTLMLGRTAVGERVWDVSRLIDVLYEKFSFLALDKLICMGVSGGGTATFYSSCIDQRIKTSITSNAFCSYLNSIVEISHCPCNHIPSIARYFDMGDLAGPVAPRNLMIVSGDSDPIFPTKNAKEQFEIAKRLYDAAGVGDKIVQVIGDGGHRFFADRCYPVLANMLEKNK